ncbi:segregation and condensation protein A [Novimethylophilus kurashikiensis]|uniref:Segregation and condensation protein A n=2 Tax=Novimethylophilus kurashikiensis TaxID=1825523 RepID=A0A2R5FAK8_9PROT|nr:segregation and condensation protein A [Novimethylophilus kurashikiensis]
MATARDGAVEATRQDSEGRAAPQVAAMFKATAEINALIHGEPLLELPQDLYIPPDALEVYLEAFEGPLDLLLYLIRKHNLDILDIQMAELTRQYMDYVEQMRAGNLELAGEYLLMSAMLIEIKSRMLLPRPVEIEQEEDPRAELVRRLLEYESMKLAAQQLDALPQVGRELMVAQAYFDHMPQQNLPTVTMDDLLAAWHGVLERAKHFTHHRITREQLSVREHMSLILRRLNQDGMLEFTALFNVKEGVPKLVAYFLAMLELAREGLLRITQQQAYDPIYLQPVEVMTNV